MSQCTFSALTLLVGLHEVHLVCYNISSTISICVPGDHQLTLHVIEDFCIDSCEGAHSLCDALSWRGLTQLS